MGKSTISMVMFNSYVKLPGGSCLAHHIWLVVYLSLWKILLFIAGNIAEPQGGRMTSWPCWKIWSPVGMTFHIPWCVYIYIYTWIYELRLINKVYSIQKIYIYIIHRSIHNIYIVHRIFFNSYNIHGLASFWSCHHLRPPAGFFFKVFKLLPAAARARSSAQRKISEHVGNLANTC